MRMAVGVTPFASTPRSRSRALKTSESAGGRNIKHQDVGLRRRLGRLRFRESRPARRRDSGRSRGPREAGRHLLERDQPGGGQNSGLTHPAAEPLAQQARLPPSRRGVPTTIEPAGAPRPFDRQNITVSTCAQISRTGDPEVRRGIEDARAVEMHLEGRAACALSQTSLSTSMRVDRAARHVVRVFDFDQSRRRGSAVPRGR